MPSHRLLLFGSPGVEHGGAVSPLPGERRGQLVAYLALRQGWVPRAELAALLWPEQDSKLAFTNLRKTLFRLQSLPWAAALEAQGMALRLAVPTDVQAFETALREQQSAAACACYRGELLAGFDDAHSEAWTRWLGFERERLRSAWRAAALAWLGSDTIDAARAIELSAQLLAADPLDEAALGEHMRWLAQDGQAGAARAAYRGFVERLSRDFGLAPGAELRALHDRMAGPDRAPPAPRPFASAVDERFIGRSVELQRIASLFSRDECRLLCLVGPGGVGKTRLAERVCRELGPRFEAGAVFVRLEDVDTLEAFGSRLAAELGLGATGDPLQAVMQALAGPSMLLALDNFEQLAEHAPVLDRLLQACPRVKLLVTSRQRLPVAGEWSMPIEGLPCPDPEDDDRAEAFDAVRLFIRAAQRVEPSLQPAAEAASIVDICRLLDGLPLAIELAAAWTRVLSCAAIADELRRGTELLRTVDPARPARQASIAAVFEQSWQQLNPLERDTLSALSLFRGGFTVEAARQVAATAPPVLVALADRSLLRKVGARNFLHPLVQQFADERLGNGFLRERTANAHSRHFLQWLGQQRQRVRSAQRQALAEVELEWENVRAAWRWAATLGRPDDLAQAAPALMDFCDHRGRLSEGLALFEEAMAQPVLQDDPATLAVLQGRAAHLQHRLDRYADAQVLAERALAGARSGRDVNTQLQAAKVLGANEFRRGKPEASKRWYQKALQLAPQADDPHDRAAALSNLALIARELGQMDEALDLSMQALLQHREHGDAAREALCLNNLGILHIHRGEYAAARGVLGSGRELCDRHGLPTTSSLIEINLSDLAWREKQPAQAGTHARQALALSQSAGQRGVTAIARQLLMRVALSEGDLPRARSEIAEALQIAIAIGRPALKASGAYLFAEVLGAQGEHPAACQVLHFAMQHPSMGESDRREAADRMRAWGLADGAAPSPWPATLTLDALAHRIVAERDVAHAGLLAALRGG